MVIKRLALATEHVGSNPGCATAALCFRILIVPQCWPYDSPYLTGLFQGTNEIIHVKYTAQCLPSSKCSKSDVLITITITTNTNGALT